LLAREAPVGVILRRGPSKWVRLIRWNTATDEFEPGQWFHGRIYADRCDLSPSGGRFLYFAAKRTARQAESSIGETWTAISRPPYLTALALWPDEDNSYCGGGLFLSENEVMISTYLGRTKAHPEHQPPRSLRVTSDNLSLAISLEDYRRARVGWELYSPGGKQFRPEAQWRRNYPSLGRAVRRQGELELIFQRSESGWRPGFVGNLGLLRRFFKTGTPVTHEEAEGYHLQHLKHPVMFPLPGVTWADWDHQGRLVFTWKGALYSATYEDGKLAVQPIRSFNDDQPVPVPPPAWATQW
jgi:hypothetical protein